MSTNTNDNERADYFPLTANTWLSGQIERGQLGIPEVSHFVMRMYYDPLRIYLQGHRGARALGIDAEDLLSGFFESRLKDQRYLSKWLQSGKSFRRWLMNGVNFYLKERRREERAPGRVDGIAAASPADGDDGLELLAADEDSERQFAREFARKLVEEAMNECKAFCRGRYDPHLQVFTMHYLEQRSHADIAEQLGLRSPSQASGMARVVRRQFVKAVHRFLEEDGVPHARLDQEIQQLLAELTS